MGVRVWNVRGGGCEGVDVTGEGETGIRHDVEKLEFVCVWSDGSSSPWQSKRRSHISFSATIKKSLSFRRDDVRRLRSEATVVFACLHIFARCHCVQHVTMETAVLLSVGQCEIHAVQLCPNPQPVILLSVIFLVEAL